MLEIRAEALAELDDVLAVLDDAAAWLQVIGMREQWPASFSADPAWVERFRGWAGLGRVYMAKDADGATVGCFRLEYADPHIWHDDSGRFVYLHSLAVHRRVGGSGVAPAMLDWAWRYATSIGAEELRLDCWAGNDRLVRYYETSSFEPRGKEHLVLDRPGIFGHQDYWVAKFARSCAI